MVYGDKSLTRITQSFAGFAYAMPPRSHAIAASKYQTPTKPARTHLNTDENISNYAGLPH
jgi:hypothetical protein